MAKSGGERVEIRSASKIYGSVRALDDVSLDIAPQEFVSLLGPSGSGKTTLLGILGGFVQPSAGTILFGGRDVTFTPPHKRDIGIVFQNYALFPHMNVGENVAFPLRARRLPKSTYAEKVRAALAMVDLAGYEERGIGQLSGGQRQRVALARAMIFEPRLILMDEPLSALDKQLRETMQIELRQLHKRLGATIIYVTHDQREALTMSDRVAILKDGKLVQIDKPERLHDHPANAFVASFIGEATLLPVARIGQDSVSLAGSVIRTARSLPATGDLVLAVHTEKLLIEDGAGAPERNRFSARVTDIVFQGESLRVFLALDDGTPISLRQPSHYEAARRIPPIGERVEISIHPQDTIVVSKAGG
jgi:putative spermidine/putrescine transport system ATP-binding protein